MSPALLLLSSSLATLRSRLGSMLSKCVVPIFIGKLVFKKGIPMNRDAVLSTIVCHMKKPLTLMVNKIILLVLILLLLFLKCITKRYAVCSRVPKHSRVLAGITSSRKELFKIILVQQVACPNKE